MHRGGGSARDCNLEPNPVAYATAREVEALTAFLKTQQDHFSAAPEEAEKLLAIGLSPPSGLEPSLHATWTQLARVLLNAHETITRY